MSTNQLSSTTKRPPPIKGFFGGELFNSRDLIGNLFLAEALNKVSNGTYDFYMAQDQCEQNVTHKVIKDKDTRGLMESQVAIFAFEGVDLDSGTVVEFMQAKTLDIPAVVYRTDFRGGSGEAAIDSKRNNWNLMVSFYPRTKVVYMSAINDYQRAYRALNGSKVPAHVAAEAYSKYIAQILSDAMEEVMASPPLIKDTAEKQKLVKQCLQLWGIDDGPGMEN